MWILESLRPLREAFKAEGAIIALVTAVLHQFLEHMELGEKLEGYRDLFLERKEPGDENLARGYDQVYDRVLELFEWLEGLLGTGKVDMRNCIRILDAGLREIQVGMIPATVDQVMVGDIIRGRLETVKALLFVGVNEGMMPRRKNGGSLLLGRDRTTLRKMDIELAPTIKKDGYIQKLYLYLMMSKPSQRLVLTYAGLTPDGRSQGPPNPMGGMEKLFPRMKTLDERSVEWPVRARGGVRELLIQEFRGMQEQGEDDREWEDTAFMQLSQHFCTSQEHRDKVRQPMDAASYSYEKRGIGRAAARVPHDRELQDSVAQLEQSASCAYAHFLRYGLELMERREYELGVAGMGNLFHQSIDRYFASVKDRGQDWRELTEEGRKSPVKECVTQVTEEYGNAIMSSSARNAYLAGRVKRITDRIIWVLAEQVKKGDFEPMGFKVSSSATDNLEAMCIGLSGDEELQSRGRIDRMDLCRSEDYVYVEIIDCKSGTTSLDLAALFYGLQFQPAAYMDAAVEVGERRHPGKEMVPVGTFYYHIGDPIADKQEGMDERDIKKQILKQLRINGLVNSEPDIIRHLDREIEKKSDVIFVVIKDSYVQESCSSVASTKRFQDLRRSVNRRLEEVGQDIPMGNMDLKSYKQGNRTAYDYCSYHAVCRFDTKTAGHGYRKLGGLKSKEAWVELESEGNEEADGSELDQ